MPGKSQITQFRENKNIVPIIAGLFSVLSIVGCNKDIEVVAFGEDSHFQLTDQYVVSEDSLQSALFGFVPEDFIVKENNVYMKITWESKIIKTAPPFDSYEQIGGYGSGPGEYANPAFLDIDNGHLFFSDNSNGFIKSVPLEGARDEQLYSVGTGSGGARFSVHMPLVAVLNTKSPYLSVHSLETETSQQLLELDSRHEVPARLGSESGDIHFSKTGELYCIPPSPYIIYKYKMITESDTPRVDLVDKFDMTTNSWCKTWTKSKYARYSNIEDFDKKSDFRRDAYTRIRNFVLLEKSEKTYLLAELANTSLTDNSHDRVWQLMSSDGKTLKFYHGNLMLLSAYEDTLYMFNFATREGKPATIDVYHFNSE